MLEEIQLPILRNGSEIIVTLMLGGHQFPWADIGGKVIFRNPGKELFKGFPAWMLKWNKSLYWVFEAEDEWGDATELTPQEYKSATDKAEMVAMSLAIGA